MSCLFIPPCVFIKREDETDISRKIWINKHLDGKLSSSQFNPQPKTTTGMTGHTRVPALVPPAEKQVGQLYESEFTMTKSGWFMGLLSGILMRTIAITNIVQVYELAWIHSELKQAFCRVFCLVMLWSKGLLVHRGENLELWLLGLALIYAYFSDFIIHVYLMSLVLTWVLCPQQFVWPHGALWSLLSQCVWSWGLTWPHQVTSTATFDSCCHFEIETRLFHFHRWK